MMRTTFFRAGGAFAAALFFGALIAPAAHAQEAASANYTLEVLGFSGSGGGACSIGFAGFPALLPVGGEPLGSTNFTAAVGFLGTSDPQPGNVPVVFGATPHFGPQAGGNGFTLSGLNFDKFGVGPTVTVDVDSVPATSVMVVSDTQLTATVPAGALGPQDVVVTSSFGAGTLDDGYIYTPAIVMPATAALSSQFPMRNYGNVGGLFETYFSTGTTSIPIPPYGTLLIAPPTFKIPGLKTYPAPQGIHTTTLTAPAQPGFSGVTIHFQTVSIPTLTPLTIVLTNRASITFQ